MRRCLLPNLFPILAAGSLGLATAVAGVWGVSYWYSLGVVHWSPSDVGGMDRERSVYSVNGAIRIIRIAEADFRYGPLKPGWRLVCSSFYPQFTVGGSRSLWFSRERLVTPSRPHDSLWVPLWFPTLLSLILPAVWLHRFRSERRKQREGLCLVCGYDLRAHAPGQVCPECGTPVPGDLVRRPTEGKV